MMSTQRHRGTGALWRWRAAALLAALGAAPAMADEIKLPPISLGAGIRSSFTHTDNEAPAKDTNDFALDSARIYINGSVLPDIKLMFNTEYTNTNAGDKKVDVIDAVGRFEFSEKFNIWAGRFLPPSDRANLYGPYYASNWKVYEDGVQDGYPFATTGRDDGVAYWGQFGIMKLSLGVFDKPGPSSGEVISAGRVQFDFWDPEPGYYLNGTYYGEKDLLALGVAGQTAADMHAYSADFLLEKKLGASGTVTVESEYARYDKLGGYGGFDGSYTDSKGWYALGAYLFPQKVGIGQFQLLGKYGRAKFNASTTPGDDEYAQRTTEVDVNYVIKTFNARISIFYKDASLDGPLPDTKQYGVGLQLQI
jgi:hypothetical protein